MICWRSGCVTINTTIHLSVSNYRLHSWVVMWVNITVAKTHIGYSSPEVNQKRTSISNKATDVVPRTSLESPVTLELPRYFENSPGWQIVSNPRATRPLLTTRPILGDSSFTYGIINYLIPPNPTLRKEVGRGVRRDYVEWLRWIWRIICRHGGRDGCWLMQHTTFQPLDISKPTSFG